MSPVVKLVLVIILGLLIGLLITVSGTSSQNVATTIYRTSGLIALLTLYISYKDENVNWSGKLFNDLLPMLILLTMFLTLAETLTLIIPYKINGLTNLVVIEFVLFLYILLFSIPVTVLRQVIGIVITPKQKQKETPIKTFDILFYIFAGLLALIPLSLYPYSSTGYNTISLIGLLAILIAFFVLLKKGRDVIAFSCYCYVVGGMVALILHLQGIMVSSLVPDILTVLGIISSAALLIALETYKNSDDKIKSLTINFLLSGILSLFSVLLGILILFNYTNALFLLAIQGILLGSILCSFSILFLELVAFGVIIIDKDKKEKPTKLDLYPKVLGYKLNQNPIELTNVDYNFKSSGKNSEVDSVLNYYYVDPKSRLIKTLNYNWQTFLLNELKFNEEIKDSKTLGHLHIRQDALAASIKFLAEEFEGVREFNRENSLLHNYIYHRPRGISEFVHRLKTVKYHNIETNNYDILIDKIKCHQYFYEGINFLQIGYLFSISGFKVSFIPSGAKKTPDIEIQKSGKKAYIEISELKSTDVEEKIRDIIRYATIPDLEFAGFVDFSVEGATIDEIIKKMKELIEEVKSERKFVAKNILNAVDFAVAEQGDKKLYEWAKEKGINVNSFQYKNYDSGKASDRIVRKFEEEQRQLDGYENAIVILNGFGFILSNPDSFSEMNKQKLNEKMKNNLWLLVTLNRLYYPPEDNTQITEKTVYLNANSQVSLDDSIREEIKAILERL